jgi:hypothetical protein
VQNIQERFKDEGLDLSFMQTVAERTAEGMEMAFENLFFDAIHGELEGLEDFANTVLASISRATSEYLSGVWKDLLFTTDGDRGGLLSFLGGVFATKSSGSLPIGDLPSTFSGPPTAATAGLSQNVGSFASLNKGDKSNLGSNDTYNLTIQALDAASFVDLAERTPAAIIGPLIRQAKGGNQSLRSAMKAITT